MDQEQLYNRIALLRVAKGLSRKDLAELVGVNHQTIGYLEREAYNPSLLLALRICAVFDLPVEKVFSRKPFLSLSEELK